MNLISLYGILNTSLKYGASSYNLKAVAVAYGQPFCLFVNQFIHRKQPIASSFLHPISFDPLAFKGLLLATNPKQKKGQRERERDRED